MYLQPARQLPPYRLSQQHGNRIPYLAHRFAPSAFYDEVIGEGLDALALAHGEVADAAIRVADHVFPAGDTVASRLDGFCGPIDVAASVAGIGARAVVEDVVGYAVITLRIGNAVQRVPDGAPWQLLGFEHAVFFFQAQNFFLLKFGYLRPV